MIVAKPGRNFTDLSSGIQATYGWYLSIIGVHPGDSDLVFMGGVTLWASDDGGFEWSSRTPPHVDMHAIAWDAAGRLLVGDDGGVHRSDDDGQNWEAKNDGLGVIQCYAGLSTVPGVDGRVLVGTQDTRHPPHQRARILAATPRWRWRMDTSGSERPELGLCRVSGDWVVVSL